jgi:hypothetical protein
MVNIIALFFVMETIKIFINMFGVWWFNTRILRCHNVVFIECYQVRVDNTNRLLEISDHWS